jgi:cell division inhibitor SepF
MSGWFERVVSYLGFGEAGGEIAEDVENDPTQVADSRTRSRAQVLSIHSAPEVKIMVATPTSFDEVDKLVSHVKGRKPVIVNFESTSKEVARRIIDFLSGAVLALNGSTMKVTNDTFLFVPSNISVHSDELANDLRDNLFYKLEQGGARDQIKEV